MTNREIQENLKTAVSNGIQLINNQNWDEISTLLEKSAEENVGFIEKPNEHKTQTSSCWHVYATDRPKADRISQ